MVESTSEHVVELILIGGIAHGHRHEQTVSIEAPMPDRIIVQSTQVYRVKRTTIGDVDMHFAIHESLSDEAAIWIAQAEGLKEIASRKSGLRQKE